MEVDLPFLVDDADIEIQLLPHLLNRFRDRPVRPTGIDEHFQLEKADARWERLPPPAAVERDRDLISAFPDFLAKQVHFHER
jgi:hypothetical protein